MRIIYRLSMPNVGSWNGKWTGEDREYYVIRKYSDKKALKILENDSYYYNFGDGWGASVNLAEIYGKYKPKSAGFSSYEWMIDEIEKHGRILTLQERCNREQKI